jgi:hypothetical protein
MTAGDYEAEGLRERAEAAAAAAGKEMQLEDASVPDANVFGTTFRQYDSGLSERQKQVERFYKTNHELQTMAFVQQQVQLGLLNPWGLTLLSGRLRTARAHGSELAAAYAC